MQDIELSLQGMGPGTRPDWWIPYEKNIPVVKNNMKKLINLYQNQSSERKLIIDKAVAKANSTVDKLFYLPLTSRTKLDDWIVLLDSQARIVGYAPVGGF